MNSLSRTGTPRRAFYLFVAVALLAGLLGMGTQAMNAAPLAQTTAAATAQPTLAATPVATSTVTTTATVTTTVIPTTTVTATITGTVSPTATVSATAAATEAPTAAATAPAVPTSASAICVACHPFDTVMKTSADYKTEDGLAVNPHTYIDTSNPKPHSGAKAVPECTNCHNPPHPLPPPPASQIPKADVEYCFAACHHQRNFTPCSQCH